MSSGHDDHSRGRAHGLGHGHSHGGPPRDTTAAFKLAVGLNLAFVVVEVAFGVLSHSLALLADAGHNFGDVLGLGMAWSAGLLSRRRPTRRHTYGFGASSTLAALANAILLLITVGGIAWEAIQRLFQPELPATDTMLWVAGVGIAVNAGSALLFMRGQADLNVRAAFVHLAGDAGLSVGVVVAAAVIKVTSWTWLDPVASLVIVAAIAAGTWDLLRKSLSLAMAAVPDTVDIDAIERYLASLPGVTQVHDLHIWATSTTETALTAHLVRPGAAVEDGFYAQASLALHDRFGIQHATFQIEHDPAACRLAEPGVV